MGSGCSTNSTNSLWAKPTTPDKMVIYTGAAIPSLGICTNDTLSEVEGIILQKLIDFSTGIGITIPSIDLTTCALFQSYITCCASSCTDLNCLMGVIFNSLCTLYTDFTTLQTEISTLLSGPYDTACLSGLGANPTLTQIIQELIKEYCALYAQVQTLSTTVSTLSSGLNTTIGNFLASALSSCQSTGYIPSGSGSSFTASFRGFVPIGSILPYAGSLSIFDTTGLGKTGTDSCGFAICNGNNGTIDMRGFVPVGAINGMGGGAVDAHAVDAGASPTAVYSLGDKVGQIRHQLVPTEVPATPVTITDPGHIHGFVGRTDSFKFDQASGRNAIDATPTPLSSPYDTWGGAFFSGVEGVIAPSITGITATTGGGDAPHENRQPSVALYFIQRIS